MAIWVFHFSLFLLDMSFISRNGFSTVSVNNSLNANLIYKAILPQRICDNEKKNIFLTVSASQ